MRILKVLAIAGGIGTLCFMSSWSLFQSLPIDEKVPPTPATTPNKALETYKMQSSLDFLKEHAPDIDLSTEIGKKRLDLLIEQYTNSESHDEIILLYEYFPDAFDYKEFASLAVAKAMLADGQNVAYKKIRQNWKGHEREPEQWLFLDAEVLINEGSQDEAASLLASKTFKGDAETERLVRLALLHLVDNPKLSWKYLSEASLKDPDNPTLNTFKANLLESANKRDMALTEYIAAVQKDPDNPHLREELADFYLRTEQFPSALKLLQDSLAAPSLDSIWLKTIFWNRVILPIKYDWETRNIPQGDLKPFIEYLLALPPGIFWNTESFERLPRAESYLTSQQEAFWLRLLMMLKNNKEQEALVLLNQNPFQTVSWMPQIEKNLKAVLTYRLAKQQQEALSPNTPSHSFEYKSLASDHTPQQFLNDLNTLAKVPPSQITTAEISNNLQDLLLSKEIYSTLFLAGGWDEAALQLHSLSVIPTSFPQWISHDLTQALDRNRGKSQALQFALKQHPNPELSLLTAELALTLKQQDIAIDKLQSIYKQNDSIGINAAKQLSKIYIDQNDFNAAKDVILSQPNLANELSSKEILARIALQTGDVITANKLYLTLEKQSSEAKSFLARKAFSDKDWKRAKALTEDLIKLHPENNILKENLHKIILEEQKENFTKK